MPGSASEPVKLVSDPGFKDPELRLTACSPLHSVVRLIGKKDDSWSSVNDTVCIVSRAIPDRRRQHALLRTQDVQEPAFRIYL